MIVKLALPHRTMLIVMLAVIGLNAALAGYGFVSKPDGSALGIPQDWLANSPFDDYSVPGMLLAGLGALHLVTSYLQLRQSTFAPRIALASGIGLVIWIITQAFMMGSFRHPAQTTLQAVCLTIGAATILFAVKQINVVALHR